jgi:hypothetical protein
MKEYDIPSPCEPYAYSVLNAIDPAGNFWFTNFDGNSINMIPGCATTYVKTQILQFSPSNTPSVQGGNSITVNLQVLNLASESQLLTMNATSSFSIDGNISPNEISFNATNNLIQL